MDPVLLAFFILLAGFALTGDSRREDGRTVAGEFGLKITPVEARAFYPSQIALFEGPLELTNVH